MDLNLPAAPSRYKSPSQIARVATEEWGEQNLYCAACDSERLGRTRTNTQARDFICPTCQHSFQLKSCSRWNEYRITDAAYDTMVSAIRSNNVPSLFVLHYSEAWQVKNLLLIPDFFFTESIIQKRKPLGDSARRAGWVGCNILLGEVPQEGKIKIVSNGVPSDAREVREKFKLVRPLESLDVDARGWTLDVLRVIGKLNKRQFSLDEVYAFETELAGLHPDNRHIRPKIRQQLQVLRDLGLLEFEGRGGYLVAER